MTANKVTYRPAIRKISILFLAIITLLIINNTVWQHVHILPDGTLISHAHPYNKTTENTPVKQHHHSSAEMLILENLEILFPSLFLTIAFLVYRQTKILAASQIEFTGVNWSQSQYGRAPPFMQ